ncbi:MAG: Sir2 family NAD-dependent protein deacetylase [Leptospiraceae bacterium]|nr:Sir2 family NAD-dependent protein deacetylase [Leptospiraceae bacterium]
MIPKELLQRLIEFKNSNESMVCLTGAGISAESGIPTFRGKEGYWVIGSKNYQPEEMGTFSMFMQKPLEVWKWFLYRKTVCSPAKPNEGHNAIVALEKHFQDRFSLITQNVDGLHFKAGSSFERTFPIHGTLERVRCVDMCTENLYPFPDIPKQRNEDITEEEIQKLKCPACGKFLRPHVLWFDEFYNDEFYYFTRSVQLTDVCKLFIIIGTTGKTTLPFQLTQIAIRRKATVIMIDIEENSFSQLVSESENGFFLQGSSSKVLPEILKVLIPS